MTQAFEAMPDFTVEEVINTNAHSEPEAEISTDSLNTENTVEQVEPPKKKRGRTKGEPKSSEEKKAQWALYYSQNKERKLKYKQAKKGATKLPENKCYMLTQNIPRYIREPHARPKLNLDWINFNGRHRSLMISQPTDELINILKTQLGLNIEESVSGVYEPPEPASGEK